MVEEKKLVIYCSASLIGIDPKYNRAADEFVRKAVAKGYTIVSGGTVKGMMGVVSDAVSDCGGRHIGIIPRFMQEVVAKNLYDVHWTDTMSERKEMMREGTCAAVALPGGIGTLDELIETLTLAKLHKYDGKIFALNIDGFYDKLAELLDFYVSVRMLEPESRKMIAFPKSVDELVEQL